MVILGLVQGLTEFLPVSGTARLIFAEAFLGIPRPGILSEAVLDLGTSVVRRGRLSYFAASCLLAGAAGLFFTKGEELWRVGNGPPIVFMPAAPSRWAGGRGSRSRFFPKRRACRWSWDTSSGGHLAVGRG